MKPVMILPPDTMGEADIKLLNDNGFCVVIANDPAKVKFVDPLPAASNRTEIENAAIRLSRKLLAKETCPWNDGGRATIASMFVEILAQGTPLDPRGTREQQEQRVIDDARSDELRKIGREEARAEREAKKQQKKS